MAERENIILELTFQFSLKIIAFCEELEAIKKFVVARQLLKSGTSIGANVHEAQNSESRADFIHKIKIALKETDESQYWLKICQAAPSYPNTEILLEDTTTIKKILSKIILTSKNPS